MENPVTKWSPAPSAHESANPVTPGYPQAAEPEGLNIWAVIGVMKRRWYVILLSMILAGAGGWLITGWMTPVYESSATLRINDRESGVASLDMLNQLSGQGSEVNTEMEVLKSRQLADSVAQELQLRLTVREPRQSPRSALLSFIDVSASADTGEIMVTTTGSRLALQHGTHRIEAAVGDTVSLDGVRLAFTAAALRQPQIVLGVHPFAAATSYLVSSLKITRPSREANIISVRYHHSDPQLVEAVPNRLLEIFLVRRAGTRKSGATSTVAFLQNQLDTLSEELRLAEDTLRAFRESNKVVSLEQQASVSVGKLAELKAERDATASELAAIDTLLTKVTATASNTGSSSDFRRLLAFPTLLRNNTASTLLTSLTTLESERGRLLATRTMKDPDVIVLSEQISGLESQVRTLVNTYADGLRQQVAAYDRTLSESGAQLNTIPAKEVALARMVRNTTVLGDLSTLLQTKLKEAQISEAVNDPSAQVVDRAIRPERPVSPRKGLNLAIATMLGMIIGLAGIFGKELLDTKVHSREDLQKVAPVPVLGVIPHFRQERRRAVGRLRRTPLPAPNGGAIAATSLAALENPNGTVLEAYRSLRTNLAFALADHPPKVIVITSPTPSDGKSTTTANLAASLAQQKLRVLVVDADMRRGALHRTLGGVRGPGLSEILTGRSTVAHVVQPLSFGPIGRIDLISTGTVPPNPAELLASPRLVDFLESVEGSYDTILIDSPPVANVSDALIIAPHADGLLLVARGNKTERGAIRFAMEQLNNVRAKVMGTVLNDFDIGRAEAYGGKYSYYGGAGYGSVADDEVSNAA